MRSSAWSVLYDGWHELIDTQREISISKSPALYVMHNSDAMHEANGCIKERAW